MQSRLLAGSTNGSCVYFNCLLCVITASLWFLSTHDFRYFTHDEILRAVDFPGAIDSWTTRGDLELSMEDDEGLTIQKTIAPYDKESYIFQKFKIPPSINESEKDLKIPSNQKDSNIEKSIFAGKADRLLLIESNIGTLTKSNIKPKGLPSNYRSSLMVWLYDDTGEATKYITLKSFYGNVSKTENAERTVKLPDSTESIALAFVLRNTDSVFNIRSLNGTIVSEKKSFKSLSSILWIFYTALILYGIFVFTKSFVESSSKIFTFFSLSSILVLFAVIVVGVISPSDTRTGYFSNIIHSVGSIEFISKSNLDIETILFKLGHAIGFWVAAFGLFFISKKTNLCLSCLLVFIIIFAISTEIMQFFRADREPRITDFLLDLTGVSLGLVSFIITNTISMHFNKRSNVKKIDLSL